MKKIFTLLFSVFIFSIFGGNFSFAQNVSPTTANPTNEPNSNLEVALPQNISAEDIVNMGSIRISGGYIVNQNDRDFTLSFSISNSFKDSLPQMNYALYLVKEISTGLISIVDEKKYEDLLSIEKDQTISKTLSYHVPDSVSAGKYYFVIDIGNNGSNIFASYKFDKIEIKNTIPNTFEIVPGSCRYFISGTEHKTGPILLSGSDILTEKCKVRSSFKESVKVIPKFTTKINNIFGDIASTTDIKKEVLTIKPGTNDISLTVPKGAIPQDYYVSMILMSEDSKIVSNIDSFNYFIEGLKGSINNTTFDKSFYKKGDTANLEVFTIVYNSSEGKVNDKGILVIKMVNDFGELCGTSSNIEVSLSNPVVNVPIKITKDCLNPTASVLLYSLDDNGDYIGLDSKDFKVITPENYDTNNMLFYIIMFVALVLLVLILSKFVFARRGISVFIILFLTISFFGFAKDAFAIYCYPNPSDAGVNGGIVFCESGSSPVGMYTIDKTNISDQYYWSGRTVSYYGLSGGFLAWPKSNINGSLRLICDAGGKYCWKQTYQANGAYFTTQVMGLSASPSSVLSGGSVNLHWDSRGATRCQVKKDGVWMADLGNWGDISSGPITKNNTVFEFNCGGYAPIGFGSITVNLRPNPAGDLDKKSTGTLGAGCFVGGWACDPDSFSANIPIEIGYLSSVPTKPVDASLLNLNLLLVGGGGGGGTIGGGGGGGGQVMTDSLVITPNLSYTVSVGAGGVGGIESSPLGQNGGQTTFGSKIAIGGGGGGSLDINTPTGGANGGGGGANKTGAAGISGGYNGGSGVSGDSKTAGGTGGGGAGSGQNGTNAYTSEGGDGGRGLSENIGSIYTSYAGGGGGAGSGNGGNGSDGGGDGGDDNQVGQSGTANTGGGGGGTYSTSTGSGSTKGKGGSGGSGIVIIAYNTTAFSGFNVDCGNAVKSTSGSNTICQYKTVGDSQFRVNVPGGTTPWAYCANEGATCNVGSIKSDVAYGAGTGWKYKYNVSGNVSCNNDTFGGDPALGIAKKCYSLTPTLFNLIDTRSPLLVSEPAITNACGGVANRRYLLNIPTTFNEIWDGLPHTIFAMARGVNTSGVLDGADNMWSTDLTCIGTDSISADINANPLTVTSGQPSTITWSSTGADSCSLTKNGISLGAIDIVSGSTTSGPLIGNTVFVINCQNDTNSASKSVSISVDGTPPSLINISASGDEGIVWNTEGVQSCEVIKEGEVLSTALSGSIYDVIEGVTYALECLTPEGVLISDSVEAVAVTNKSICSLTSEPFVNTPVTWTISNSSGDVGNTVWSGTNISPITTSGGSFTKVYTTVGTKQINATTTITRKSDGTKFNSSCSTSTIIRLDPGSNIEI